MKYYLNESIKYILSEQFVLNEAMKHSELIVQCVAIREYIKKLNVKTMYQFLKKLNKYF